MVLANQSLPYRMNIMASRPNSSPVIEQPELEEQDAIVKPPPMFQVMLLNDDYTPMEFVVIILEKFFGMGREAATQVMLKVHQEGRGVCGVYPHDVAATKVDLVCSYSRQQEHPLQCVMEEA